MSQQCVLCDAPIPGDAFHIFECGKSLRFCTSEHRQQYRRSKNRLLLKQDPPRSLIKENQNET